MIRFKCLIYSFVVDTQIKPRSPVTFVLYSFGFQCADQHKNI